MNIAIDMMGGDFAPEAAAKGVAAFLAKHAGAAHLQLVGDKAALETLCKQHQISPDRTSIIEATQTIGYHDHPVKALREKPQSSIAIGFALLAGGRSDAFISAGNTGAMLVGSMFSIKPMPGVLRPTIATIVPREHQKTGLLLDVGINADCKPENLNQFAQMGAAYAKTILGIDEPRVGLLNIGEEEGKGNLLAQAAYPLLKQNTSIHFIGNVEGRDILEDSADVIVCDGFTGNVLLKLLESLYPITKRQGIEHPYFNRFHFEQYGGTPVLGIEKPVIIGHGVSGTEAFMNMISLAEKMIATRFLDDMSKSFSKDLA
ncbi:MAG: phosphate acyltransferase PlsX [Bacteroidetes bacterium]|nr:MAG: phosphate acyltransferase PlsX [Bacteroidota bacterium]